MRIKNWLQDGARREKILVHLPVGICLLVAAIQSILTLTTSLSPWKGGGFGMFSVVDKRSMTCRLLLSTDQKVACRISFSGRSGIDMLNRAGKRSLSRHPTAEVLQEIADAYLKYASQIGTKQLSRELRESITDTSDVTIKAIKLEMWELEFDAKTFQIKPVRMGIEAVAGDWHE